MQNITASNNSVSDQELKKVIADFIDQGLVENIVVMFRREPSYLNWSGELLKDERLNVRLGIAILFEELQSLIPEQLVLAIPSLKTLLLEEEPLWRGEAVSLLGYINTDEARGLIASLQNDPSPQVREIVDLMLESK